MKKSGLLLPIASVANKCGIGDFGPNAYKFIDELKKTKVHYWQILPLNRLSYGNSPYQPLSSYAIDEIYISLTKLKEEGLIKKDYSYLAKSKRISFWKVREFKENIYREAYKAFLKSSDKSSLGKFAKKNAWVKDYAYFISLKNLNDKKPWNEWNKTATREELSSEIKYQTFLQYVAFKQWNELHEYAKENHIEIIGDMPFYVGYDSSDVYFNRECFLLDEKNNPKLVAGVPPDYFSKTGQLWGNPIYNFMKMRETGYDFYIQRIAFSLKMYDLLRIDHFRAFDSYYVIPFGRKDAIVGEWWDGPNYDFFNFLKKKVSLKRIIAEDLGDLRPSVLTLRDAYSLPGMNVTEFTILDTKFVSKKNMIAYTGTHDNDTLKNWYRTQKSKDKKAINAIIASYRISGDILDKFIYYTLKRDAKVAIVPMQDILKLGKWARMNVPGTVNDLNWSYRFRSFEEVEGPLNNYRKMLEKAHRTNK